MAGSRSEVGAAMATANKEVDVIESEGHPRRWLILAAVSLGMFMTLVCFCEEKELAIDVYEGVSDRRMKMVAPRLKAERIELGSGEVRAEVSYKGEALMTLKAEENGNYVVMIFEDGGKGKKAISFYDPKFVMAN